jgi:uncharacterized protein
MHLAELTPPEQRVLGCLIEKRWTTPDQYPLSLNGLRLACNQSTNRDPVTAYDEATVREAAQRLCLYGLARLASGHGSRAVKYRHLAEEALGLDREELAVLAVLLLRGPQTPGELKARTERMAPLASLDDVERVIDVLSEHGYARRIGRRPGQKEDRFEHLLGGAAQGAAGPSGHGEGSVATQGEGSVATHREGSVAAHGERSVAAHGEGAVSAQASALASQPTRAGQPAPAEAPPSFSAPPAASPSSDGNGVLADRVAALEEEVAALRAELEELRELYG